MQASNIAILILAYRYPAGLKSLSRIFDIVGFDTFIHVDAKVAIEPFVEAVSEAQRRPVFISDRSSVYWRGFTMVEATIGLLKAGREKHNYSKFVIISDDSSPIVALTELKDRLSFDNDLFTTRKISDSMLLRYERFLMLDSAATQVRWIPIVDREFSCDSLERLKRLAELQKRGKKPIDGYWHGSQWMALRSISVERILESWNTDLWLKESFEFSDVPDEAYFHTILASYDNPSWCPFMLVDWSVATPPKIFTNLTDLAKVSPETELFVRKIGLSNEDLDIWTDITVSRS